MLSNEEFVDCHVADLRDNKVPALLAQHPGAVAFLREFGDLSGVIVAAAAMLGPDAEAYAKRRLADLVLELGKTPSARLVR